MPKTERADHTKPEAVRPIAQDRPVNKTKASSHVVIYSNFAEIQMSAWDFRIKFGRIERADEKELAIEELATVYMSPEHMKVFLGALQSNVSKYEERFGPIKGSLSQEPSEKK
jgi:hypothetical protein